ncbi:ATP-binding cassette domain-containing protein [Modestobacter sp. I12A-02628]|uniref:ABC transporter ATP-binding protein n=1 Tax=Goekera deserti TaxID=2497753 RepID=A0A7K3W8K9_9ACTN|nr:ABC transporter ATP-binding protein [Goekera deserti]MPR00276.1 ATP-binding cassette domain-containing protein [Goekera deserti]NDI49450.1 ATP-binding cassette domain-containing protein [Goekera deserti]NEL52676.1 ABC transporter ATP-binding protein [Goekera deserti]
MTDPAPLAVELRGITKRFPGVVANRDIELRVRRGEVHAIVGENGAGKSTLMKTLYGMHRPDEGQILLDGREVSFKSPGDAIAAGIGMVHQHFMLADNLTVLENVVLGAERSHGIGAGARRRISEISEAYALGLDPDDLVEDLGVGDRQRVEIAKVLYRGATTLILDEPTAVLVPQEVDELFGNLAELKREGLTVIFISHKLDEVRKVADAITVIRRGTTVGTADPATTTAKQLAELMVGAELPTPQTRASTVRDTPVLELLGVTVASPGGRPAVDDVTLTVREGEVVGIAGVEGNGQAELVDAVMGLRPLAAGTIRLGGEDVTAWTTRRRREGGVGFIPEDRHRQGMLLDAPLWENRILGHQTRPPAASRRGRGLFIDRKAARADTARIMSEYDVRAPGPDTPAVALSGGNQQKLIVGREMSAHPRVLIAAHPTRGVDVGAQSVIWELLKDARAEGMGIVLISADLDELIGLSDTLHVMLRGAVVATLDPAQVTPEQLGGHMTGAVAGTGAR